ncbi:MAG: hypothetical protein ABII90_08520 [Bacteroidota bacterium]
MKRIILLLVLPCIIAFAGCNSESSEEVDRTEYLRKNHLTEIDLSEFDLPLIIDVPDSTIGELTVEQNSLGGVDIMVGNNFQVQIAGGEGNMASKKADIEGDAVYQAEYLIDEESALFYKREIPGAEMDPEYHFFVIVKAGNSTFEISDIEGEIYPEKIAQRMFDAAKAIQVITQTEA